LSIQPIDDEWSTEAMDEVGAEDAGAAIANAEGQGSSGVLRRIPAPALVLGAAVSVQGGAAIAKLLFPALGPPGVVFLRLLFGSVGLLLVARPRLRGRRRHEFVPVVLLGLTLAAMNTAFYEAIDRVPLGIGVTVEFAGPLVLAVVASRRRRDLLWIGLAGVGIALLSGGAAGHVSVLGVALAALAGVLWATYIVLGTKIGRLWGGSSGLAVAMWVGAVAALPWGLASGGAGLTRPSNLLQGAAVGVLCSALPWSFEIEAMRRLPTHVFGVLTSSEPAVAAVSGLLFLGERLHALEIVAIVLVVVASAGAARDAPDPSVPLDP
jgi:inner membrane transporter RhtA